MFGFLEDIAKAAVSVVTLPVAVVADVVTLGGELNDKRGDTYTEDAISDVMGNLKNATTPK
jgi:hypothetical protein